jgi:leucyl aminopeptidase (aminopeptidase T)
MGKLYEFELGKAAKILVEELFRLKEGEEFVITADTECDMRVVEATARATFAAGAKPVVIWLASPLGVGKAADPMLPMKTLTAALKEADAWVEFNNQWLLYSTPWDKAIEENKKLRYLCLVGMDADMMIRCIGRVDFLTLVKFQSRVVEMTKKTKRMRVTTPAGTDVSFNNVPGRPVTLESGYADTPGPHFLSGQIGWAPKFESINGVIAFDGSLVPPVGLLKEPVKLHVKAGAVEKIEGGKEAVQFEDWLKGFNDPNMLRLAHICYGFHPGAKLTGNILEDERVWGGTEWGLGNVGPMYLPPNGKKAASHTDGICLNSSVWLDEVQLTDKGKVVNPQLIELAKKLGKA